MFKSQKKYALPIATITIVVAIFIIDQLTKLLAIHFLKPYGSLPIIGDFFRLTYVENHGMAFGIEIPNKILLNIFSITAAGVIFYYLFLLRDHIFLRIAFAAILGGAFGNLTDRFLRGKVVDFLDLEFFDIHFSGITFFWWEIPQFSLYRWPVFNVADVAVTIGMAIVILTAFLDHPIQVPANDTANKET